MKWLMLAAGLVLANAVQAQSLRGYGEDPDDDVRRTWIDERATSDPWLGESPSWAGEASLDPAQGWRNPSTPGSSAPLGSDPQGSPSGWPESRYAEGFERSAPYRDGWVPDRQGNASGVPVLDGARWPGTWSQGSEEQPDLGSGDWNDAGLPDAQGYRFRGDPPPSSGSRLDPYQQQDFRFRPLTSQERERMGSTSTRWRPLESARGGKEPSSLFDSMTSDDPGEEPGGEAWSPH